MCMANEIWASFQVVASLTKRLSALGVSSFRIRAVRDVEGIVVLLVTILTGRMIPGLHHGRRTTSDSRA